MNKVKEVALGMFTKEEILEHFGIEEQVEKQEEAQKFGELTLEDGSTILYYPGDELTVGTPVFQDESQETPVEDGSYMLEDGNELVVADGMVESIEMPGEEEEAPAEEAPAEDAEAVKKENNQIEEIFEALAPVFQKYDEAIATLTATVEELMGALKSNNEKVEAMSKLPAATHEKASKPQKRQTQNFQILSAEDKLKALRNKNSKK